MRSAEIATRSAAPGPHPVTFGLGLTYQRWERPTCTRPFRQEYNSLLCYLRYWGLSVFWLAHC